MEWKTPSALLSNYGLESIYNANQVEQGKVALIFENCSTHPIIENLSYVKLVFFATKYYISELGDGWRRNKMSQSPIQQTIRLVSLDSNKLLPKVSLLTALQLLVSAGNKNGQTTIVNFFKKAKISEKDQTIATNDEDDPFKEINENMKELWEKESNLVPENTAAEEFALRMMQ